MPVKGFKKQAGGGLPIELPIEPTTAQTPSEPRAKKRGRPKGSGKGMTAKQVRDKMIARFQIDEFLDLIDKDDRVKRYFYLELIPKLLPKLTEKEVQEKFGVSFIFGDRSEKTNTAPAKKETPKPPLTVTLSTAPKPEGME